MVELPPAPVDLTVEEASNTNLLDPTDRGVLLLWNEPAEGKGITSYVVERKIGTGDWTAIGTIQWTNAAPHLERTSFSDRREYIAGEDLSYRVGSRGSSAVGVSNSMEVTYPTHQAMHGPTAPQMVEATVDSDTEVTVSWQTPVDNGGSAITGYTVRWKQSSMMDYADADMAMVSDAMASMHQVTGLMAYTSYDFQVRANNAAGMGYWSMEAMAMTDRTNTAPTAGDAIDDQTVAVGMTIDVQSTITDSDMGDSLTWEWSSSDPGIATVEMDATDGSMATVTGVVPGTATITVTATDSGNMAGMLSAMQMFDVTVHSGELTQPMLEATPGTGSVTLTWDDQPGAVEYTVAGARADASPVRQGMPDRFIWETDLTDTSLTLTGLTSGAEYLFFVAACGDMDCTEYLWSNLEMVTPN